MTLEEIKTAIKIRRLNELEKRLKREGFNIDKLDGSVIVYFGVLMYYVTIERIGYRVTGYHETESVDYIRIGSVIRLLKTIKELDEDL